MSKTLTLKKVTQTDELIDQHNDRSTKTEWTLTHTDREIMNKLLQISRLTVLLNLILGPADYLLSAYLLKQTTVGWH